MPDTQISDEMVEKAARAVYEHEPIIFRCEDIPWSVVTEGTRDRFRHKGRAALTAALAGHVVVPREPTGPMIDAGLSVIAHSGPTDVYRAMIDAAPPVSDTPVSGWRDIASAPKDGTRVLLYTDQLNPSTIQGQWKTHDMPYEFGEWVDVWNNDPIEHNVGPVTFSHWQPLPASPVSRGE